MVRRFLASDLAGARHPLPLDICACMEKFVPLLKAIIVVLILRQNVTLPASFQSRRRRAIGAGKV